ncbi:unnamed protein product [Sphagnum jensenii]|uniref:Uncharacterized protein n=1 Tax=Sphagnum jensenii TaxID=128206 RepID=A0ABP0VAC0_9BRYO
MRVHGHLVVTVRRRDGNHHKRLRVAAQGILQQPGQLRIAQEEQRFGKQRRQYTTGTGDHIALGWGFDSSWSCEFSSGDRQQQNEYGQDFEEAATTADHSSHGSPVKPNESN